MNKNFWNLEKHGEQIAIFSNDYSPINYLNLAIMADSRTLNLNKGKLFVIECSNNLNTVLVYLGALRKGAIPLMVSSSTEKKLLNELYEHFEIEDIYDSINDIWIVKKSKINAAFKPHSSLGLLLSTSGSTGSPKLVRLSLENLSSNALSIASYLNLDNKEVCITSLPLSYSYGLSILNSHLLIGGKIVLTENGITSPLFWELFKKFGVTSLSGVPATWRILRKMRFEKMLLPSLKTITQAGGRLEAEEISWLNEISKPLSRNVFVMYGQTEATARISYLPTEYIEKKLGSIGKAIPGGSLTIQDSKGAVLPPGVEGELVYEGPNVMLGYAVDKMDFMLGRNTFLLRTGDLAKCDEDGFFWITGRLSRFIKLFGNRFALDDVERYINALGIESAVTGDDDCLMIAISGSHKEADDLELQLSKRYKVHKSAIKVVVSEIPRNNSGKILYLDLKNKIKKIIMKESGNAD